MVTNSFWICEFSPGFVKPQMCKRIVLCNGIVPGPVLERQTKLSPAHLEQMNTLLDRVNMLVMGIIKGPIWDNHCTATILAHECDFLKNSL